MLSNENIEKIKSGEKKSIGNIRKGKLFRSRIVEYELVNTEELAGMDMGKGIAFNYRWIERELSTLANNGVPMVVQEYIPSDYGLLDAGDETHRFVHIGGATVCLYFSEEKKRCSIVFETDVDYDNIDKIVDNLLEGLPQLDLREKVFGHEEKYKRTIRGIILDEEYLKGIGFCSYTEPDLILETGRVGEIEDDTDNDLLMP